MIKSRLIVLTISLIRNKCLQDNDYLQVSVSTTHFTIQTVINNETVFFDVTNIYLALQLTSKVCSKT